MMTALCPCATTTHTQTQGQPMAMVLASSSSNRALCLSRQGAAGSNAMFCILAVCAHAPRRRSCTHMTLWQLWNSPSR